MVSRACLSCASSELKLNVWRWDDLCLQIFTQNLTLFKWSDSKSDSKFNQNKHSLIYHNTRRKTWQSPYHNRITIRLFTTDSYFAWYTKKLRPALVEYWANVGPIFHQHWVNTGWSDMICCIFGGPGIPSYRKGAFIHVITFFIVFLSKPGSGETSISSGAVIYTGNLSNRRVWKPGV